MIKSITLAAASLSLLAAPTANAATGGQVETWSARQRDIRLSCDDHWRTMTPKARAEVGAYGHFLDRCLSRCPTLRVSDIRNDPGNQNFYEGRVRRSCDIRWQHKLETNTTGSQTYADFISRCARACAPPVQTARPGQIPQLTQLANNAAQGVGVTPSAAGGVGAVGGVGAGGLGVLGASATAFAAAGVSYFAASHFAAQPSNSAGPGPIDLPTSP